MSKKRSKLTLRERVSNLFENNPIIIVLWIITVTISSLITIGKGTTYVSKFINQNIRQREFYYKKISQLHPNLNIREFNNVLGESTIASSKSGKKEYLFVNNFFYTQAITDNNGKVIAFALTTRTKDFQPSFLLPGSSEDSTGSSVQLLATKFYDEITLSSPICHLFPGANRFSYFEEYYGGNPSNYQTVLIGINDAGYFEQSDGLVSLWGDKFWKVEDSTNCELIPVSFRKSSVINTIIITAPFVDYKDISGFHLGVDKTDVVAFE